MSLHESLSIILSTASKMDKLMKIKDCIFHRNEYTLVIYSLPTILNLYPFMINTRTLYFTLYYYFIRLCFKQKTLQCAHTHVNLESCVIKLSSNINGSLEKI